MTTDPRSAALGGFAGLVNKLGLPQLGPIDRDAVRDPGAPVRGDKRSNRPRRRLARGSPTSENARLVGARNVMHD